MMDRTALLIGLAAGFAAALLFAAVTGGGLLGMPLFILSPLPIAIASLGWGTRSAILAAVAGAIFIALLTTPAAALLFAVLIAAPMAWYGHLAGLARPTDDPAVLEWYPLARVFAAITVATPISLIIAGRIVGFDLDVDRLSGEMADMFLAIAADGASGAEMPTREDLIEASRVSIRLMPMLLSMIWFGSMASALWLAGRVVRLSGRLRRPWQPVSTVIGLPPLFAGLFAGSAVLAGFEGSVGLLAGTVAGTLAMAFAMIGFAVLHVGLKPGPGRRMALTFVYGFTFLFTLPLIPIAIIGIADSLFALRARRLAGPPPLPPR